MHNNLVISLVTPSFNQCDYIEDTINSIVGQDYPNLEYIIMDGASTDGTVEILNRYKDNKRIAKIISEKDNGQTDALIKGFNLCTGDVYCWINSDDLLEKDALRVIAELFMEFPQIDVLVGNLMVIDAVGNDVGIWPRTKMKNNDWHNMPQGIGQPSVFFRSRVYKEIGGLSSDLEYSMDYDLFMRFGLRGYHFYYIDNVLAKFRIHEFSKSIALPYKQWKEEFKVFRRNSGNAFSRFYYWKIRGIISKIIRGKLLRNRKW